MASDVTLISSHRLTWKTQEALFISDSSEIWKEMDGTGVLIVISSSNFGGKLVERSSRNYTEIGMK